MPQELPIETQGAPPGLQLEGSLGDAEYDVLLSPERKAQILRDRARALAQSVEHDSQDDNPIKVVEFLLGQETFAFEARYVREIYRLKDLTPLPCTPPHVLGIMNVRGLMLAVIDVRTLFQLSQDTTTDRDAVVIIHGGGKEVGVLTDGTLGVRLLSQRDVHPAPPTLTGVRAEYLRGVTSQHMVILEAAKLLAGQEGSAPE